MTSGTRQVGSTTTEGDYYYRTWSGANGKSVNFALVGKQYKYTVVEPRMRRHTLLTRVFNEQKQRYENRRTEVLEMEDVAVKKLVTRFHRTYLPGPEKQNNYSCTARRGHNTKGSGANVIPLSYCYSQGSWSPVWNANDTITLQGKLAEEIRTHSFNLGVAVAEGGEAVKMVANCLSRFTGAIKALKHGRVDIALRHLGADPKPQHKSRRPRLPKEGLSRKEKAAALVQLNQSRWPGDVVGPRGLDQKDISSLWLEIQYGWQPLLSDVYSAMEAWSAIANQPRKQTYIAYYSLKPVSYTYTWSGVYTWTVNEKVSQVVRCETTEVMSVARSLGLYDPAIVVWEKVPFSFVADWFVPIGNYLEALAFLPKTNSQYCFTLRTKIDGTSQGLSGPTYRGSSGYCSSTIVSRVVTNSWAVPKPIFKPLDKALSVGHIENGLALLHQLVI